MISKDTFSTAMIAILKKEQKMMKKCSGHEVTDGLWPGSSGSWSTCLQMIHFEQDI